MNDTTPSYRDLLEQIELCGIEPYNNALIVDDLPPKHCISLFSEGSQETDPCVYPIMKKNMAPGSGVPTPANGTQFDHASTNEAEPEPDNTLNNLFTPPGMGGGT